MINDKLKSFQHGSLKKIERAAMLTLTCSAATFIILGLFRGNLRVGAVVAAIAVIAFYFIVGHF